MICPKCGYHYCGMVSEVKTTGSDYSLCQGILGTMLFGPLGTACGWTDRRETEFSAYWVCKKCGYKFKA